MKFIPALTFIVHITSFNLFSQPVPGEDENIEFLVTFGRQGETSWGDDDFSQTWFFAIPKDYTGRFYIRVFDPGREPGI